ncbi:hypothetical protein Tco_0597738 [Tanacetum coccineum]
MGRTTWRASGSDVPRTLPGQIGMPSFPFGMILGTKPESLKIAKTGQRARSSYDGRQGSRSLARLRDQMDEMLRLQRLGSNTKTGVPYTEEEIMAIVRKGKRCWQGIVWTRHGWMSDNIFSHMLDQFESSPEFGGPSGGGGCGDDEPGGDEDGDEDEEDGDS